MGAGAQAAAERLYTALRPTLMPPELRGAAACYLEPEQMPWVALSSGEQAIVRIALSLGGFANATTNLWRDLSAVDVPTQARIAEAISESVYAQ